MADKTIGTDFYQADRPLAGKRRLSNEDRSENFCEGCFGLSRRSTSSNASSRAQATEVDKLVANEMNLLSKQQREKVFEDIHAVAEAFPENDTQVAAALEALENKLQQLRNKGTYGKAMFLSPSFAGDRELRLAFLRAEFFDIEKTKERILCHFDLKLKLFGIGKLGKHIEYSDLHETDINQLRGGNEQSFPEMRDRSNRQVYFVYTPENDGFEVDSYMRAIWYLETLCAKQESVQRLGIVLVLYTVGMRRINMGMVKAAPALSKGSMIRHSGVHFCAEDYPAFRATMSLIQLGFSQTSRLRFRAHFGSHVECLYSLQAYGILADELPIDRDGHLTCEKFHAFLDASKDAEEEIAAAQRAMNIIVCPAEVDVILGRGNSYPTFPGNQFLESLVRDRRDLYKNGDTREKQAIINELIEIVHGLSGRFLKRKKDQMEGWEEVPYKIAYEKVSHALRANRKE